VAILDQIPRNGRILVIRIRSLGDCVLTTPALRILKAARPDCHVGVVVESRFHDLFTENPDIDYLLEPEYLAVVRFDADLCLNLHGGIRSLALTIASGARWRAGFGHFKGTWVYNVLIPRAQQILGEERTVHTAEHLASAMFHLGALKQDIPRARLFARPEQTAQPYAVLHAMASAPEKTWPAERFLKIAHHLQKAMGLDPVFIGAAMDDLSPFSSFRCVQGASLQQVQSLLAGASLFIGNDSGPAHMAAAFGLPVVVLFGSSDPVVWAPWKTVSEVLVARDSIARVTLEEVIAALERLKVKV